MQQLHGKIIKQGLPSVRESSLSKYDNQVELPGNTVSQAQQMYNVARLNNNLE